MSVSNGGLSVPKMIISTCLVILFVVGMKPMVTAAKARRSRIEESMIGLLT